MGKKARDYKISTKRRLDTLSGNQCAAPECERPLLAHDGHSIVSKICHIEAASEGGPRFNPNMDDDDRRHYSNLILLCDECHQIIDNPENAGDYPVALLKSWKLDHESKMMSVLNSQPSLLITAIDRIAEADFEAKSEEHSDISSVFNVSEKITYNELKRNASIIEEYKIFYGRIASIYDELQSQGSFKKESLLRNVRMLYLKAKGKYVGDSKNPLELVRKHADDIFEDVEGRLLETCEVQHGAHDEEISFGVSVIMVDAFIRCKILEAPGQ